LLFDGNDVGAGDHHIAYAKLAELEQVREHSSFLRRQLGTLAVTFLYYFFETLADAVWPMSAPHEKREPMQQRGGFAVAVCGRDPGIRVRHGSGK
jgi:hypothetical protein